MKTSIILLIGLMSGNVFSMAGGSSTGGVPNPAAVNCLKLGGVLETTQNEHGVDANCAIDEWKLYTEMNKRGLVKKHSYRQPPIGLPNPASVNCNDIKGSIRIVTEPAGQRGICVVGQWDLFRAIDITREY